MKFSSFFFAKLFKAAHLKVGGGSVAVAMGGWAGVAQAASTTQQIHMSHTRRRCMGYTSKRARGIKAGASMLSVM